jgi:hypothetical protein
MTIEITRVFDHGMTTRNEQPKSGWAGHTMGILIAEADLPSHRKRTNRKDSALMRRWEQQDNYEDSPA